MSDPECDARRGLVFDVPLDFLYDPKARRNQIASSMVCEMFKSVA